MANSAVGKLAVLSHSRRATHWCRVLYQRQGCTVHSNGRRYSARPLEKDINPKIGRLVLVRHGQSEWNVTDPSRGLTARFTGWANIDLTQQGRDQAVAAGRAMRVGVDMGIIPSKDRTNLPAIDVVFCSLLRRACDTMSIILEEIGLAEKIIVPPSQEKEVNEDIRPKYRYPIPIIQSWRLNERHYGALVGMSKEGAERLFGKFRLTEWKETWDGPPPPISPAMLERWKIEDHCQPMSIVRRVGASGRTGVFDPAVLTIQSDVDDGVRIVEHGGKRKRKNSSISSDVFSKDTKIIDEVTFMPVSESLRDTYERFLPLWVQGIAPHIRSGRTVCVVAHANTIRSILFAVDGEIATKEYAKQVKIPSALPIVYEFVDCDNVTGPSNKLNGRECSGIIPGKLRLLKPLKVIAVERKSDNDLRHKLNGTWVETDETKSVSFCASVRPTFQRDEDFT